MKFSRGFHKGFHMDFHRCFPRVFHIGYYCCFRIDIRTGFRILVILFFFAQFAAQALARLQRICEGILSKRCANCRMAHKIREIHWPAHARPDEAIQRCLKQSNNTVYRHM